MITHEIVRSILSNGNLPDEVDVILSIERIITQFNLHITQKSPLSTMKGSTHYHLKQGKQSGVLELTYWPARRRLFIEIHHNRMAAWNAALIAPFAEAFALQFQGEVEISAS